jgi:light-regulated signal transduction histidine kinase (bacteriophytochrome)
MDEPQLAGAGNLFELHPAPSLLFGRDGVIAHVNAAARQLLRADGAVLQGERLVAVFPELAEQLCALRDPLNQRRVVVRRLDGSNFMACVRCVPAVAGALLLAGIEDLSENESEISAANREFEALTSAAGHDLRGPLRILKGFAEALDDECSAALNDEGKNFLAEILKASDRMEGLIDGLLTFSRASRADVSCETLDLTTLIELVLYELRHAHADREVECSVEPGLSAWGDVRLIMTVLRSLLGNGWKFTARRSGAQIRCHGEQRDGRSWICVTDNGAGFDMSQSERLFKPFTRFHRQDEFPGHGMGLATVQRILRRHGGEISAESTTGEGTTVRFWLPPRD